LLIWRYRDWLFGSLPRAMKTPLLVVCVVSIVLGMGSLKPLHVPTWLSPFDILRPLPGFRSIGATGRFWGFLALPLSLFGAAALWRFVSESHRQRNWRVWLGVAFAFQFAFQSETFVSQWFGTSTSQAAELGDHYRRGAEEIEYVTMQNQQLQGDLITPTRAVLNCYDLDDFIHADVEPGNRIVKAMMSNARMPMDASSARGKFVSWNHMQIDVEPSLVTARDQLASPPTNGVQLVLNQAFNADWRANGCKTVRGANGNLVLECPADRLREGPINAVFHNDLSSLAAEISLRSWRLWFLILSVALAALFVTHVDFDLRRRAARSVS
jgi:hypothetical protein